MQFKFENKLTELGLSYRVHHLGFYNISSQKGGANPITVRLINSLSINNKVRGRGNGIEVQAFGRFKFKLPSSRLVPDILSFAFQNTVKNQVEFLIVPTMEFLIRHFKMHPGTFSTKSVMVEFWLMEDGFVYDTTNISSEGEWYFLSKGTGGRMSDGTDMDYSGYLSNWPKLKL